MKDTRLPLVRELIAGLLALTVMAMFFFLLARAMQSVPSSGTTQASDFGPVKELLAIVNPVVGLIIGYYFSRATTEARAETAEAAAETANDTANKAQHAASTAEQEKARTQSEAEKSKGALQSLVSAVEGSRIQSDGEHASRAEPERAARQADTQLLVAVERAKEVLGQRRQE
jgi:hypothetical protein